MIKMLDKISRKHYIQCALTLLLTGIILWFTASLWSSKSVIASFVSQSERDMEYKVYYTQSNKDGFKGKWSVTKKIEAGNQKIEIALPIKNLAKFRLDLDKNPGKVVLSDIILSGSEKIALDGKKFSQNQIDKYEVKDDEITIVSKQKNPYIVYKEKLNLKAGLYFNWCRLIIISVLSFLLMYKFVQYLSKFKIEKHYSRLDIFMLAIFFALLFIPMSHISDATKSEQEKRMLAKKPQLMIDKRGNNNYGMQFDAWYNDHFFGRDIMIGLYNYLKFSIKSVIENDFAFVGDNGFMYTKKHNAVNMYKNSNLFTDKDLEVIGRNMEKFIKDAQKAGVKNVYFMLSNDKESMYPEYYPSYIKKVGKVSRLEQLLKYIHNNYPQVKLWNFRDKFEDVKKNEIVFCKTGTHMNRIGAFYEYYFLTSEIKKDYPEIKVLTLDDFNTEYYYKCDDDIYKSLGKVPYYSAFYSKENFKNKNITLKKKTAKNISKSVVKNVQHFSKVYENKKANLNILIIGDSFVGRYIDILAESFKRSMYIYNGISVGRFMYTDNDVKAIKNNIPDIVVVESAERGLQSFLTLEFPALPKKEK